MKRSTAAIAPIGYYILEHISDHSLLAKTPIASLWATEPAVIAGTAVVIAREKGVKIVKVLETKPNYHCLVEYLK